MCSGFRKVLCVSYRTLGYRQTAARSCAVQERLHLDEIQRLLDLSASEDVLERVLVGNKVRLKGQYGFGLGLDDSRSSSRKGSGCGALVVVNF